MASAKDERKFITFQRGEIRDNVILAAFRNHLRTTTNPDTGLAFTEDEIFRATQQGSRFWAWADAIDLMTQAHQSRALYLADQLWPARANTEFLEKYHGPLWLGEDSRLDATGGSGTVTATGTGGSVFPGSTTIGDATAAVATDPNGNQFQVLYTAAIPTTSTSVTLTMKGIDTGQETNLAKDTDLTWSANAPLGADAEASVAAQFSGGFNEESDAEYGDRIEERIRYRPASGNSAHFLAWARNASTAIETAVVYPTAFHAGSVLVSILEKRAPDTSTGPLTRVNPAPGTFADVVGYLVPPNSPVVPQRAYVVVTSPNPQYSDVSLRLSMAKGRSGGWADYNVWPIYSETYPEVIITSVIDATKFTCTTDAALPGGSTDLSGADAPSLMLWHRDKNADDQYGSRFEALDVSRVYSSGTTFTVELNAAPSYEDLSVGQRISPYTDRLEIIAQTAESYFDELGPGEVVDETSDLRGQRARRFPPPSEQYPSRAGSAILSRMVDVLGGAATDTELSYISRNEPDLPNQIIDGPNQVVLGHLSVFPL
jgi:uncharacterized phage protein gp47/JayE